MGLRQDFKVWIPLLDQSLDREYIKEVIRIGTTNNYKSLFIFSKQKYGVSKVALQSMMNGVKYIM